MTVTELITILHGYDGDLDVRLGDWSECCVAPVRIVSDDIFIDDDDSTEYLQIGNDH